MPAGLNNINSVLSRWTLFASEGRSVPKDSVRDRVVVVSGDHLQHEVHGKVRLACVDNMK